MRWQNWFEHIFSICACISISLYYTFFKCHYKPIKCFEVLNINLSTDLVPRFKIWTSGGSLPSYL